MSFGTLSTGTQAKLSPQLLTSGGRPRKFTLERLQQIRNLVERGTSREEIAKILDVTVGSLQVTCSKVGISLRRPKLDIVRSARRRNPLPSKNAIIIHHHEGSVPSQPSDHPAAAAKPQQAPLRTREVGSASVAIRMQYKGMERTTELPLTLDEMARLAWEAECRDMRIGQFIGEIIAAMVTKDLFRVVLDKP